MSEREPGAGAQAAEELARLAQELADERRAGEELRAQLEERARAAAEALAEVARVRRAGGQVEEKVDELEKQVRARHIGRGILGAARRRGRGYGSPPSKFDVDGFRCGVCARFKQLLHVQGCGGEGARRGNPQLGRSRADASARRRP